MVKNGGPRHNTTLGSGALKPLAKGQGAGCGDPRVVLAGLHIVNRDLFTP
jgi:hypothetical protein